MWVEYLDVRDTFLAPTRGQDKIDGAYDKMIVRPSGINMPLRLLPPCQPFDMETFEACYNAVKQNIQTGWADAVYKETGNSDL